MTEEKPMKHNPKKFDQSRPAYSDNRPLTPKEIAHRSQCSDRNIMVTRQVLNGGTLEAVGKANGVTPERVRQIVAKTIRVKHPEHCLPTGALPDINWLRAHRGELLQDAGR